MDTRGSLRVGSIMAYTCACCAVEWGWHGDVEILRQSVVVIALCDNMRASVTYNEAIRYVYNQAGSRIDHSTFRSSKLSTRGAPHRHCTIPEDD